MGCHQSKQPSIPKSYLIHEIKHSIESEDTSHLISLCKLFGKGSLKSYSINTFVFPFKSKVISIPAYCIYLSKHKTLSFLHDLYEIDYIKIEDIFSFFDTSVLQIICSNNCLNLLEFYLPIYINLTFTRQRVISDITLEFQSLDNCKLNPNLTPIQIACEMGYIEIMYLVYNFFQGRDIPTALDVNFTDPITGENCALIACRSCNYNIIKFLHVKCSADFHKLNNKHESALQIIASSSKASVKPELFRCLQYLVEQIGVNILYGFEETLLILENSECIAYVERQLALKQVFTSKTEIEYINRMTKRNSEEGNIKDIVIDKNSHPSTIEPATVVFGSLAEVVDLLNKNN